MVRKFLENKNAVSVLAVVGIIAGLVVAGGVYYAFSNKLIPTDWFSQN